MSKYKTNTSKETIRDAEKIAKATQRPGQNKEQTRLIAQGIQKGIEHYKKRQKTKSRELDKKLKTVNKSIENAQEKESSPNNLPIQASSNKTCSKLPWILLILSWSAFALYWTVPAIS